MESEIDIINGWKSSPFRKRVKMMKRSSPVKIFRLCLFHGRIDDELYLWLCKKFGNINIVEGLYVREFPNNSATRFFLSTKMIVSVDLEKILDECSFDSAEKLFLFTYPPLYVIRVNEFWKKLNYTSEHFGVPESFWAILKKFGKYRLDIFHGKEKKFYKKLSVEDKNKFDSLDGTDS